MISTVYKKAFSALMKKPVTLWGISLLYALLCGLASVSFGAAIAVSFCIVLLLETSMTIIFLKSYRGNEVHTTELFDCFRDWKTIKRVLGGMAWMELWIFLWALIPVVGIVFAIMKIYEYRFTPYILIFEPDVPATEAIKVSSQKTEGHRGQMFGADILAFVIIYGAMAILGLLTRIPYIGILFGIILFFFTLFVAAFFILFMGILHAAFYEEITNPVPFAPPQGTKFCTNCGAPLQNDTLFCPKCGTKV